MDSLLTDIEDLLTRAKAANDLQVLVAALTLKLQVLAIQG